MQTSNNLTLITVFIQVYFQYNYSVLLENNVSRYCKYSVAIAAFIFQIVCVKIYMHRNVFKNKCQSLSYIITLFISTLSNILHIRFVFVINIEHEIKHDGGV